MQDIGEALRLAMALIAAGNADLVEIIGLSLRVSLSAVLVSCLIGLPVGAAVAMARFPGRSVILVLMNALMGLPPVVVGLLVYLMLSNAGPFGWLQLQSTFLPAQAALNRRMAIDGGLHRHGRRRLTDSHTPSENQRRV